jgi:leucyl-tRNA synthetase
MAGFPHREIDAHWQAFWRDRDLFTTRTYRSRPKYCVLDMFPYPSGAGLHVGHQVWPAHDEAKLAVDTITLAVQIAGKMRGTVEVPADVSESAAIAAAKADPKIARYLEGKTIRRDIYVPGRLVNLVAT